MIRYEGLFFEGKVAALIHLLDKPSLEFVNDKLHCTFKYLPDDEEIFDELAGKSFEVYIVGYGNDGKNSGFAIELPKELQKYYINYNEEGELKTPHITVSLSKGSKAVDTCNLEFKPLKKPIKITGKFGYWLRKGPKEFISYQPYLRKSKR